MTKPTKAPCVRVPLMTLEPASQMMPATAMPARTSVMGKERMTLARSTMWKSRSLCSLKRCSSYRS